MALLASLAATALVFGLAVYALPRLVHRCPSLGAWAKARAGWAGGYLPAFWKRAAARRIVEAGSPPRLEAEGLLLASLGAGAIAALVAILFLLGRMPAPLALVAIAAPFLPWLHLARRARERKASIARALPFVLDLLTLVVEAGNDLLTGLARVTERMGPGPLRDELLHLLRELRMGRAKREVFTALGDRTGSPEVGRMVAAILQADRMGAPVGESLRILSGQILSERFLLAEKRAAQAPVKMLLPLVAFIFPAVFLVLFAPIALALLGS